MMSSTKILSGIALVALAGAPATAQIELANANRGFELGDTTDWVSFPTGNSTFSAVMDPNSGVFGGFLRNDASGSSAVIKQANLGEGLVTTNQEVTISFFAKGSGDLGGIVFAEFFNEIAGGGVSSGQILGGGHLALTTEYQEFNFTVFTDAVDVSGGVTLQFAAVTGANIGSFSEFFVDDVSVTIIPAPAAASLLAGGVLLAGRRRR